jgi:hypothetical protein
LAGKNVTANNGEYCSARHDSNTVGSKGTLGSGETLKEQFEVLNQDGTAATYGKNDRWQNHREEIHVMTSGDRLGDIEFLQFPLKRRLRLLPNSWKLSKKCTTSVLPANIPSICG